MTASVRATSRVLAGRDEELEAAFTALTELRESVPGIVLIGGRSRIGKTRLVGVLADWLRSERVRVLVGGCIAVSPSPR